MKNTKTTKEISVKVVGSLKRLSVQNCLLAFLTCWLLVNTLYMAGEAGRGGDQNKLQRAWMHEERNRRQLSSHSLPDAPLADPDRLWPNGIVEYEFRRTLSREQKRLMESAMEYVTQKVPCVTFSPATPSTAHYVMIQGGPRCESALGMVGGEQQMLLNEKCFDAEHGLLMLVQELLHTLGFVYKQNRPDRDHFINLDLANVEPEMADNSPLSLIDQVELALAYGCTDNLATDTLIEYIHSNRMNNALRIDTLGHIVNRLSAKISGNDGEMKELKDTVNGHSTRIGNNENGGRLLKSTVNRLSTRMGNNENGGRLLKSTVDRLSKRGAQCGYRGSWSSSGAKITYEKTMVNTGSGSLYAGSGTWIAQDSGLHLVSWDLRNNVDSRERNVIYLYKNKARISESWHGSYSGWGGIDDQGGRTLVLDLQKNDQLHLQTSTFDNDAYSITFCVALLSAS